jgi:hypothetical protein
MEQLIFNEGQVRVHIDLFNFFLDINFFDKQGKPHAVFASSFGSSYANLQFPDIFIVSVSPHDIEINGASRIDQFRTHWFVVMVHGTYLGWSYRLTVVTNGNVRGCIFLFFALNFLVNVYTSQHNTTQHNT